ncbi:MAG: hypothetical protein U0797_20155 [Gemmataceae bacterium]
MLVPSSTALLALLVLPAADAKASAAAVEHFEKQVRPLLVEKCVACHGPEGAAAACGWTAGLPCSRAATAAPPWCPATPTTA